MYKSFFKRFFDFVFGVIFVFISVPLIVVFACLIALESKGPIFFKQERLGKSGKTFILLKLRSLRINNERKENQIFKDHPDMTPTGKFIRRFKIDGLPHIFNVLKGDMSIVGPRPCLPSLIEKFDENGYFRLKVRPGLTGCSQVNGNAYNSWATRWELDRYHVENMSLLLDFKILIATIGVVLFWRRK
ncbi:MAG: sugar transferase [Saprospiraceae bacterium]|nr:sugar transferase [Saprospiraceae bacterium]